MQRRTLDSSSVAPSLGVEDTCPGTAGNRYVPFHSSLELSEPIEKRSSFAKLLLPDWLMQLWSSRYYGDLLST